MTIEHRKEKYLLSNSIFDGKSIPDFILQEAVFTGSPVKLKKVFPSLGLSNFKEITPITKPFFDLKKENTFVLSLLKDLYDLCFNYTQTISNYIDEWQFLCAADKKEELRPLILELNNYYDYTSQLVQQLDPRGINIFSIARIEDGRIALKIVNDLLDANGKPIFRKDVSLFKVYGKIVSKLKEVGLDVRELDELNSFKIFSKENVSCKDYYLVFSSDKQEGAWDLLTMSMRGIRSCQRWDGEHRQCVIGSILSKFIGIIYITSGNDLNGLGSKMFKRCIVRYAVDSNTSKPAIILDKMYPDFDEDILKSFTDALSKRTSVPVFYGPKLGKSIRNFYLPYEHLRSNFSERKWSYQDINLKSKLDKELSSYISNLDCLKSEIASFCENFKISLTKKIIAIIDGDDNMHDNIKPIFMDFQSYTISYSVNNACLVLLSSNIITLPKNIPTMQNFLFELISSYSKAHVLESAKAKFISYIVNHLYLSNEYGQQVLNDCFNFFIKNLIRMAKHQFNTIK